MLIGSPINTNKNNTLIDLNTQLFIENISNRRLNVYFVFCCGHYFNFREKENVFPLRKLSELVVLK